MAAPTIAAAYVGKYTRTFVVTTGAGGDTGDLAAPCPHGLEGTPLDYSVVDTTANASALGNPFIVHSVGATTFQVRKSVATAQARTALVTLRLPHSVDR
jgi:hypothetical protein